MAQLTPSEAAQIASSVYLLREDSVSESLARGRRFGTEGKFQLSDKSQFQGESGALAWKQLSGFGYIAWGEGAFKNEVLVATRGTDIDVDWLTNLNIGMRPGPGSWPVHMGFHNTWKSFSSELARFLAGRNPSRIHCVGHSLGGALASLTLATYVPQRGSGAGASACASIAGVYVLFAGMALGGPPIAVANVLLAVGLAGFGLVQRLRGARACG